MRLKAGPQILELVAGVDVGPQRDIAAADLVAHVAQVFERFDDHVTHDEPGTQHRPKHGNDGERQQHRPIVRLGLLRLGIRKADLDHRFQVAGANVGLLVHVHRAMAGNAAVFGADRLKVAILRARAAMIARFVPVIFRDGLVAELIEHGQLGFVERLGSGIQIGPDELGRIFLADQFLAELLGQLLEFTVVLGFQRVPMPPVQDRVGQPGAVPRVASRTKASVLWLYHQKLPMISVTRHMPNRKKHFRSRLASPSTNFKAR